MATILITGANGAIANALIPRLEEVGYTVKLLTASASNKLTTQKAFLWNIKTSFIEHNAFKDVEIIVHLAGANVGKRRWTKTYKQEIYNSRIMGTELLFNHLKNENHTIAKFISASGIGFYPDPGMAKLDEESSSGHGFMATVCKDWEAAAIKFKTLGSKVVILRTAPVLMKNQGLLPAFTQGHFLRTIPTLGSPNKFLSWIHIEDMVEILLKSVNEAALEGIYNATSPQPVTQKDFVSAIDHAYGHKNLHPNIPSWLLIAALGEKAVLPLTDQEVYPTNLLKAGFKFKFPSIDLAINQLLSTN